MALFIRNNQKDNLENVFMQNEKLREMVVEDMVLTKKSSHDDCLGEQIDYFTSYYASQKLSQDCFIENGTYTLYEQTVYNYDKGEVNGLNKVIVEREKKCMEMER